jgi:hypothetical protein
MPVRQYLKAGNPAALKSLEALYVAVTRARYSVAFVVDHKEATYYPATAENYASRHILDK